MRKQWPLEVYGMETILDEGIKVEDLEVKDVLLLILSELKIIRKCLSEISDMEIEKGDLDDDN